MPYKQKYTTASAIVRHFFTLLLDAVAPPRKTEFLVRTLTQEHLFALASAEEETLPYSLPEVTALVWELKYRANMRAARIAGAFLANQLVAVAAEELDTPLLVPLPMHKTRLAERGHNQTELLCQAALQHMPPHTFEYAPAALVRTRATPPQQGLSRKKRLQNALDSMRADTTAVEGRVCVVIDDVATTGATLEEARRALAAAGARRVHCLALARA